jgi:Toprim-like
MTMEFLSLVDLETHDPYAPNCSIERDFLCPFPDCTDKQIGSQHRSLSVNAETGLFTCHRCNQSGKLREFWDGPGDKKSTYDHTRKDWKKKAARKRFEIASSPPPQLEPEKPPFGFQVDTNPDAIAFLRARNLPISLVVQCNVLTAGWYQRRQSLVFPLRDEHGRCVALQMRFIDGLDPKVKTEGKKSVTLFSTPGALQAETFAVTEAPMDAIALAACGLPAVAMIGTTPPDWLRKAVLSRLVLVATDADVAGDEAAGNLIRDLPKYGARVERLRPPCKDWNEALIELETSKVRSLIGSDAFGRPNESSTPCHIPAWTNGQVPVFTQSKLPLNEEHDDQTKSTVRTPVWNDDYDCWDFKWVEISSPRAGSQGISTSNHVSESENPNKLASP